MASGPLHGSPPPFVPGRPGNAPSLPQLRLIVWALLFGQLLFGGILLVLASSGGLPLAEGGVAHLDVVALAVAASCLVAAFAVRRVVWARARGTQAPERQRIAYAQGVLVFFAMLEGGALLNLVVSALAADFRVNAIAAAVLFATMLASLPSEEQLADLTR